MTGSDEITLYMNENEEKLLSIISKVHFYSKQRYLANKKKYLNFVK